MKNFCIWSMSSLSRKNPKVKVYLDYQRKYYESNNEFELALKQITDPTIKNAISKLTIREDRSRDVFVAGNRLLVERFEKNENKLLTLDNRQQSISDRADKNSKDLKNLQEMTEELRSEMRAAQVIANLGSGLDSRKRPRGVLKL